MRKSMDFEFENGEKLTQKRSKKICFISYGFFVNFGTILEGFGIPSGGQDGPKMGKLGVKKTT